MTTVIDTAAAGLHARLRASLPLPERARPQAA